MSNIGSERPVGGPPSVAPRKMVRPIAIVVIVAVVILGGIFGWQVFMGRMMGKFMAAAASAPQTVSTYVARTLSWQSEARAVGNVRALHGADLAARMPRAGRSRPCWRPQGEGRVSGRAVALSNAPAGVVCAGETWLIDSR